MSKLITFYVGMEKEQKEELGWRVSVLSIPAFHCTLCMYMQHIMAHNAMVECRNR